MINPNDQHIGRQVRRYRNAASLNLGKAAIVCRISDEDYRAKEAGLVRFSARELFDLCLEFKIKFSDLFVGLGEPEPVAKIDRHVHRRS